MELSDVSRTTEWPQLAREAAGSAAALASSVLEPVSDALPGLPRRRRATRVASGMATQIRRHPVAVGAGAAILVGIVVVALRDHGSDQPAEAQFDTHIRSAA